VDAKKDKKDPRGLVHRENSEEKLEKKRYGIQATGIGMRRNDRENQESIAGSVTYQAQKTKEKNELREDKKKRGIDARSCTRTRVPGKKRYPNRKRRGKKKKSKRGRKSADTGVKKDRGQTN